MTIKFLPYIQAQILKSMSKFVPLEIILKFAKKIRPDGEIEKTMGNHF